MYPRISDLFNDLFGFSLPFPIYSFGFMVAAAMMTAAWLLQKELDRLHGIGRIGSVRIPDPKPSKKGKKGRKKSFIETSPSYLVGTMTVLAVVAGFAGAKLFHILENLSDFFMDPLGMIFSTGGFTFYGGLILAAVVMARFVKRKGLSVPVVADAFAPGMMLGYGIGRIGCHLSGDGDWGIASNMAAQPGWVPTWLWAETYPNNILGIDLAAAPVYPTPIYETAAAVVLFSILFRLRNHTHIAGWLFWLYIALNGLERFFIEKIRVNNRFDVLGITMTQAEIIAVFLIVAGCAGMWKLWRPRQTDSDSAPVGDAAPAGDATS